MTTGVLSPSFSRYAQVITSKPEPEMNAIVRVHNDAGTDSLGQQSPDGGYIIISQTPIPVSRSLV